MLIFHIDDILMSPTKAKVVTKCMRKLDGAHGVNDPLTLSRGKHHEQLGMVMDFNSIKNACIISQCDFFQEDAC